jgi:hypothetical protein
MKELELMKYFIEKLNIGATTGATGVRTSGTGT